MKVLDVYQLIGNEVFCSVNVFYHLKREIREVFVDLIRARPTCLWFEKVEALCLPGMKHPLR